MRRETMTETTRNPWAILLVLSLGFFMILLDMTIVYVATPSILTSLHTSLDQVLWVFNGYLLAFAVLLITAGRVGDIFGPRQLFAAGLVLFTVASALCGLSQTDTQLIAARVLQGVGGAMLAPQTLTIITSIFPAERRGAAFGIWGAVAGISTILGPTLGGLIVTNWEWRWIFYMNVPLGVIALIGTFVLIPDLRPGRRHRLDLVGVALSSVALFAIVYGLIEGQRYDWGTITGWLTIPMVIGFGIVLLAVFLVFEQFQAEPLLPLRLFTIRNFSIMNWVAAAMAFGMQGIMLPLIIYTQSVLGMSPLLSGLTFAPMSVASMFVAPFAGRLTDRFGGKYFLMGGLTLFGTGMAVVAALATVHSTWQTFVLPLVVSGVGMGMIFAPMTTTALRDIQPHQAGAASGVLNTTRQLGAAFGAAGVGAVLQNRLAVSLHDQAVTASAQLPLAFRSPFVNGFSNAAKTGFQVGRGQTGGIHLPANVPAQVATQLQYLVHDVFNQGYILAMRPTIGVGVAILALAALSCVLVSNKRAVAAEPVAAEAAVA
ncbi:MAG: DHA2 family efflux MFS transporter permease subunit [Chloroflexi bacterium]|nr:MAG: DHA2 family efflux MFS transporter permease subunit [Chloroflexota bacterium]